MKKLLLILLFTMTIFAVDQAQLINMVKQNPALLDSPQGELLLRQYGMTKQQVLELVNQKTKTEGREKRVSNIENDIMMEEDNATVEAEKFKDQIKAKLLSEYEKIIDEGLEEKMALEKEKRLKELEKKKPLIHPFTYVNSDDLIEELKSKQHERKTKELKRFSDGFFDNKNQQDIRALPVPEWYKISVNDEFIVTLFGAKNETSRLKVKSDGSVMIPSYGPLSIGGKSYKDAEKAIKEIFKKTFPNNSVVVDIDQYSTMQVTVTGEVAAPGIYNLRSLSTLKDALMAAKGVNKKGSIREILLKRDGKTLKKVDLYDYMLNGDSTDSVFLKANDVVFVPMAKNLVTISGEVKREAIYELKENQTLYDLLNMSGGTTAKANTQMIGITRYDKGNKLSQLNVTQQNAKNITLRDMDSVYIYPINEKNVNGVYVYGNVLNPGFWELSSNEKTVGGLFKKEIDKQGGFENIFLPDTHFEYVVIKRFDKNLSYKILQTNLNKEIDGTSKTVLFDKDEIYIFDKRVMSGSPFVEIAGGPVLNPGKYMYFEGMSVEDIIAAAGVKEGSVIDKEKVKVGSQAVNIHKSPYFKLTPFDDIYVYDENLTKPKTYANIYGEVYNPGIYEINEETTLKDIINMAGGLTQKAALNKVEITHYEIMDNSREKILEAYNTDIEKVYAQKIREYDEIRIFRIPKWDERQTVTLKGEVKYPGEYVINRGERLFEVIRRAGGFTDDAFIEGAVFSRESLKKDQQKELKNSLFRLKQNITAKSLSATDFGGSSTQTAQTVALIKDLEAQAEEYAPQGRIALQLANESIDMTASHNNIILEDKDTLYVPSRQSIVTVIGEVLSQSTIIYQNNKGVDDYIELAGGLKETANEESIFIIHANGMTEKAYKGWFSASGKVKEGDIIFVPPTIDTFSNLAAAKDITSIVYQLAISAASLKTIGAL